MEKERNKQIDGIRGIAAIIILIFHMFCRYLQIYENSNIGWMEQWGSFGVVIFMLISGYFLGIESGKEKLTEKKFKFFQYLFKKLLRLWPCYILAITLTMITVKCAGLPGRECSLLDYILNIFFINGFIGTPYVDGAHWYLTTLISITAIIGIIKKIKFNKKPLIYCIWILVTGTLIKLGYGKFSSIIGGSYLGVALVGFAIAKFLNKKEQKYNKEWIILFIFSIVYCFIMQGIVGFIILALGTIIITMCLMKKMKFLESSIFLWLGKISYPLYLIHQNIGFVIIKKLSEVTGSYQIIFSIIASICVLVLAVLIYYFDKVIEEKVKNKIRKRLIKI